MGFISKYLIRPLKIKLKSGATYECPLCGYQAGELETIGVDSPAYKEHSVAAGGRRQGGCYNCRSNERERHLYLYLKNYLPSEGTLKTLHIAPEKRLVAPMQKLAQLDVILGDLDTERYAAFGKVEEINVLDIPHPDDSFHLVLCNHVLEHIEDDARAMSEIYRILKPGGQAILMVPLSERPETYEDFSITDPKDREKAFGQFDHVRLYGQDYFDRLESVGFKIDKVNLCNEFPKAGIDPKEDLVVCTK